MNNTRKGILLLCQRIEQETEVKLVASTNNIIASKARLDDMLALWSGATCYMQEFIDKDQLRKRILAERHALAAETNSVASSTKELNRLTKLSSALHSDAILYAIIDAKGNLAQINGMSIPVLLCRGDASVISRKYPGTSVIRILV